MRKPQNLLNTPNLTDEGFGADRKIDLGRHQGELVLLSGAERELLVRTPIFSLSPDQQGVLHSFLTDRPNQVLEFSTGPEGRTLRIYGSGFHLGPEIQFDLYQGPYQEGKRPDHTGLFSQLRLCSGLGKVLEQLREQQREAASPAVCVPA